MRRLLYLLTLVLFVSISATCMNASTDCERWFKAYRAQLAHTRQMQRVAAAKRRAKLYAQRKLSGYVPKPKPKPVVKPGLRMTRKQALHRFDLACGELPENESDEPVIAKAEPPPPFASHPLDDQLDPSPAVLDQMIGENDPPPFWGGESQPPTGGGGYPNFGPPVGGGGSGGGGGSPGGGQTVNPTGPTQPTTPDAPPAVPEPGSFVLVLTGAAAAAGALRQRFKA
jgi:hypothetical protein